MDVISVDPIEEYAASLEDREDLYSIEMAGKPDDSTRALAEAISKLADTLRSPLRVAPGAAREDSDLKTQVVQQKRDIWWIRGSGVALIGGLCYLFYQVLPNQIDKETENIKEEIRLSIQGVRQEIPIQIAPLDKRLAVLDAKLALRAPNPSKEVSEIIEQSADTAPNTPDFRLGLATVTEVTRQARNARLSAPAVSKAIENAAATFVNASESGPYKEQAWNAVLAMMEYRSYLSEEDLPAGVPRPSVFEMFKPLAVSTGDKRLDEMDRLATEISQDHGFTFATYGTGTGPDRSLVDNYAVPRSLREAALEIQSLGKGPAWMMFSGISGQRGRLNIGGKYFRRFIFRDMDINYRGGVVRLDQVYFVNCTFSLSKDQPARQFALEVLKSPGVTFNN